MPWFILSAEYGLLEPDAEVEPYERTLNTMSVSDRREWARRGFQPLKAWSMPTLTRAARRLTLPSLARGRRNATKTCDSSAAPDRVVRTSRDARRSRSVMGGKPPRPRGRYQDCGKETLIAVKPRPAATEGVADLLDLAPMRRAPPPLGLPDALAGGASLLTDSESGSRGCHEAGVCSGRGRRARCSGVRPVRRCSAVAAPPLAMVVNSINCVAPGSTC